MSHLAEIKLLTDDGKGGYQFSIPELVPFELARIVRMERIQTAEVEASKMPDATPQEQTPAH